jgi:hypothetical protein
MFPPCRSKKPSDKVGATSEVFAAAKDGPCPLYHSPHSIRDEEAYSG